jgi:hypothetical protein
MYRALLVLCKLIFKKNSTYKLLLTSQKTQHFYYKEQSIDVL